MFCKRPITARTFHKRIQRPIRHFQHKLPLLDKTSYDNPLTGRYASKEMSFIFSPQKKFSTWRGLWIALARAQKELGLDITDEQIRQMERFKDDINFDVAKAFEKDLKHDVMSHIKAFGEQVCLLRLLGLLWFGWFCIVGCFFTGLVVDVF